MKFTPYIDIYEEQNIYICVKDILEKNRNKKQEEKQKRGKEKKKGKDYKTKARNFEG